VFALLVVIARGLRIVYTRCASVNLAAFVRVFESEFDVFVDVDSSNYFFDKSKLS